MLIIITNQKQPDSFCVKKRHDVSHVMELGLTVEEETLSVLRVF